MRIWLFYKRIGEKSVEFRAVYHSGKPTQQIVAPLNDVCTWPEKPTEKEIEAFVRRCKWVAEPPRPFDHPVAQMVLKGEW